MRTGSWIIVGSPPRTQYEWIKRRFTMCDEKKAEDKIPYHGGYLGSNKLNTYPQTEESSSANSSLVSQLEREALQLSIRLDKINSVLQNITPEIEFYIEVQKKLRELGYR